MNTYLAVALLMVVGAAYARHLSKRPKKPQDYPYIIKIDDPKWDDIQRRDRE